jgi:PAS domain S-box-containing protein
MGALMRDHDWEKSSLGPVEHWPQALRTAVRLMLNTGHPMYIWWGPQLACLYNDAYRASIGPERHPGSLGRPAREVWDEIWPIIGPQIDQVMAGRGGTWHEDALVPITRNGRREDVYWTYSYSPVDDEQAENGVGGVLVVCSETTRRVLAELRLNEEMRRQRGMFQRAPGFIAVLSGPDHRFEFVNDAYVRLVGDREYLGKPVREVVPEAAEQGYFDILDGVYQTGERFIASENAIRLARTPGAPPEERFIDFVYEPITDASGSVTGIFVQGSDVTDRALANTALRASERRLRDLNASLEAQIFERSAVGGQFWQISPDLLGVLRPDAHFERANPAWQSVLGWAEDELRSMSIFELLHPDDREPTRGGFEHLKAGNPILRFENRYRHKDGSHRWFAWAAAPLGDAYYCSGRDITSEKVQSEALAERTAELGRVYRHSRDLQVVIGTDGVFRAVNPAWTDILGHSSTEAIGHYFTEFILPEDAASSETALASAAHGDLSNFENRYRHKNGSIRWISWHTSVEGDLVYGYGRDVTEQKEAQRELALAQEALRQSQKMEAVGQLTGGLAHDFNNLLTGISGNLTLLKTRLAQDRVNEVDPFVAAAEDAATRAATLTHRLLAFSRRQTLAPKPTDIHDLVTGMEDLIRRTVGPTIALKSVISPELWPSLIDPNQLESAILNLCINARDAMEYGGRITIECGNRLVDEEMAVSNGLGVGEYVSIAVSDTGVGMAPDVVKRALEPFFTTKPIGTGTGLGLSMTYGFAKQSGGSMSLHSEPGKGSTICVFLPRYYGSVDAVRGAPASKLATPMARPDETVLVIDDEPTVRVFVQTVLAEHGYTAIAKPDGPSGLAVLESDARVDLLITDVGLPGGLNGREVADAARELRPGLKVLFITGYVGTADLATFGPAADLHVLPKPFSAEALANSITELLTE